MKLKFSQSACFRLRTLAKFQSIRWLWWSVQGATFGSGTSIPKLQMTWPHQVRIGAQCLLEDDIYFKFDGIWQPGPSIIVGDRVFLGKNCEFNVRQRVQIGDDCLIASGCKFVDHDHGVEIGQPMNLQEGREAAIVLAEDVWLGCNVVVLKGVTIGRGAIVGAGAVVTKSIPAMEIWGGVPARKIGERQAARIITSETAVAQ